MKIPKDADLLVSRYIRSLSGKKREAAEATRRLIKRGVYPSVVKTAKEAGWSRTALNEQENGARYMVLHSYEGTKGSIEQLRNWHADPELAETGLMFRKVLL